MWTLFSSVLILITYKKLKTHENPTSRTFLKNLFLTNKPNQPTKLGIILTLLLWLIVLSLLNNTWY